MEEIVKRHILEPLREKYHRAGKLAKGELLREVQELLRLHIFRHRKTHKFLQYNQ